ncbi:uncharacterized protein LOC111294236 isoform X2 [Durio zibethinus]|uniref:Uncharacterized protein LOC111294236 isoform X2 n=1 Tax=Durio zibethinus TaxID=66656 RepID=A0A6P5YSG4_DURZI|nr:uncharacterized protein LOC111294236 isoform X2 [Durio zibethinus]
MAAEGGKSYARRDKLLEIKSKVRVWWEEKDVFKAEPCEKPPQPDHMEKWWEAVAVLSKSEGVSGTVFFFQVRRSNFCDWELLVLSLCTMDSMFMPLGTQQMVACQQISFWCCCLSASKSTALMLLMVSWSFLKSLLTQKAKRSSSTATWAIFSRTLSAILKRNDSAIIELLRVGKERGNATTNCFRETKVIFSAIYRVVAFI